jgi:hypothetical protein
VTLSFVYANGDELLLSTTSAPRKLWPEE